MITVDEIKKKALKAYIEVLKAEIAGRSYFPFIIRSDKSLSKDFVEMSREIAQVMSESKDRKGYGYTVYSEPVKNRKHGTQDIPKSIKFETLADYLKFIGKTKEYARFGLDCSFILAKIPKLNQWLVTNPGSVISNSNDWEELLKVCHWFLNYHEPGKFYIRELPIDVHTKFIETNTGILRSLLDSLVPDKVVFGERDFEKRFGLKYAEPRIRVRFLDDKLFVENRFKDISIPLHEFAVANFDCANIIITENKMNFLTLPQHENTIAIWGGGYAVKNLKDIDWLKDKRIFYWGDIDVHGFEILSQLRSYYNQAVSIMMDEIVFRQFSAYHCKGSKSSVIALNWLFEGELKLYKVVKENDLRLEQEKIPQDYVNGVLGGINNHR